MAIVRNVEPMGRHAQPCFEAQLMDWCDDVAYAVHDVVDFYRSGQIPLDRLLALGADVELSPDALLFLAGYQDKVPDVAFDTLVDAWREVAQRSDIQIPWEPRARIKEQVQSTTSRLITFFVNDVGWTDRGTRGNPQYAFDSGEPLRYSADFAIDRDRDRARQKELAVDLLKELPWIYVIERAELQTQQFGQASIISGLVTAYCEDPTLLPPDRQEERAVHQDDVRAAVDHVASLTEETAVALYRRLTGVSLGRISDIM
jgi:dGTPase